MGLIPREYYMLTPVEFGLMYHGHLEKETKRKKELRLLSFFIVKGWADPKDMAKSPEEWWPIDKADQASVTSRANSIANWSEEEKNAALELIKRTVGG